MYLISVYVAVGVISFWKCEFSDGYATFFQNWNQNQIFSVSDEWHPKEKNQQEDKPNTKSSGNLEEISSQMDEFRNQSNEFLEGFRQLKNIYFECKTKVNKKLKKQVKSRFPELKNYILSLYQCVKVFTLRSLDKFLQDDFVPLTDFAYFVKDGVNATEEFLWERKVAAGHPVSLKDYAANVLERGWTALLYDRVEKLLQTHSLKFQMNKRLISKGRSRRRDHRMFAMMVMGFMIMASILIPMGFQFLTVLGGKSLLLAKLALIMSAINGLKKIATSNVGYGFYHTGNDGHHHDHIHHGFHEKNFHGGTQNYNGLQGYNL